MQHIEVLFLLFLAYSMIGWIMEVTLCSYDKKKLVNRGFLIGPYCPIYGCGAIAIILLLTKYQNDPFILFTAAVVICSALEYITSYLMEKIFKARWWDYSHRALNINGRVCIVNSAGFGVISVVVMYFINPTMLALMEDIPFTVLTGIATGLFVIFLADVITSLCILLGIKKTIVTIKKDSTEEITAKVRAILREKSFFSKRILQAYPNVQAQIDRIKDNIVREKERLIKEREKIEKEIKERIKKI